LITYTKNHIEIFDKLGRGVKVLGLNGIKIISKSLEIVKRTLE